MNRTLMVRIIAIIMAIIMALSVVYIVVGSFSASAVTQSEIDSLKSQQKEYEKKKQEIQSQLNSLQYQQKSTLDKKNVLDQQIMLTQSEIDNITEQIAQYDLLIVQKQGEVKTAQQTEDNSWSKYKVNMRTMEENGTISYISVIFQAHSFSDLLARIDFVGEIMQYDERLYQQLKADKEATIAAKNALQAAKENQEAARGDLIVKQTDRKTQLEASNQLLQKIENDINQAKQLYQQENAAAATIQSQINEKAAELKKQQQAAAAAASANAAAASGSSGSGSSTAAAVKGSGDFTWPSPSCNIVTSPFGMRLHPIYQEYRMHYGVDIGVSYGSSIVAADDGTVIISTYDSSYGYYIVVDHGNGFTSLYAHLSQLLKKSGATVKKGDTIAYSGSSGASTGAHLHFEISSGGTRVNPLQYYSNWVTG